MSDKKGSELFVNVVFAIFFFPPPVFGIAVANNLISNLQ